MAGHSLSDLRSSNRRALVAVLASEGASSRADLARRSGLSRTTVSSLVTDLIERGQARETDRGRPHKGGSGRPPVLVALTAPAGVVAGVDIGHQHVRVAVADRSAVVLAEDLTTTDADPHGARTLDVAADLVARVAGAAGVAVDDLLAVGLCVPGPVDRRSARVDDVVLPGWHALAPAEELGRRLDRPVVVDNDANLGALAEHQHGAGAAAGGTGSAGGSRDMVYLKLASGVGAGLVLGGRLHRGVGGLAGELGHLLAREDGDVCRCGSRGCLETEVSVLRLLDLLRPVHGPHLDLAGVLRLDAAADPGVRRVLDDAGRVAGRVLAHVCTTLNPALVVVGGGLGSSATVLGGIRASIDRFSHPEAAAAVRVLAGHFGDRAEVMGALAIAAGAAAEAAL